jgi:hypothetical protein
VSPTVAQQIIQRLRGMTAQEADRTLCDMHSDSLHGVAKELGIRLPIVGGDKPSIIIGALRPRQETNHG